jgi:hypothetical protein
VTIITSAFCWWEVVILGMHTSYIGHSQLKFDYLIKLIKEFSLDSFVGVIAGIFLAVGCEDVFLVADKKGIGLRYTEVNHLPR